MNIAKIKSFIGELSNDFWIASIIICIFLLLFIGFGYSCFSNKDANVVEKVVEGGYVTLKYADRTCGLSLINAIPTTDMAGSKDSNDGKYFDFSVETDLKDASKVEYEIYVKKVGSKSNILDDDIKVYLEKEDSGSYGEFFGPEKYTPIKAATEVGSEKGSMVLANIKRIKSGVDNYRLRIWLSDTSMIANGNYSIEVKIVAKAK